MEDEDRFKSGDPFVILGVDDDAELGEIRRAYARLIRQFRPNEHPEEFRVIHEAFEVLRDAAEKTASRPMMPIFPLPDSESQAVENDDGSDGHSNIEKDLQKEKRLAALDRAQQAFTHLEEQNQNPKGDLSDEILASFNEHPNLIDVIYEEVAYDLAEAIISHPELSLAKILGATADNEVAYYFAQEYLENLLADGDLECILDEFRSPELEYQFGNHARCREIGIHAAMSVQFSFPEESQDIFERYARASRIGDGSVEERYLSRGEFAFEWVELRRLFPDGHAAFSLIQFGESLSRYSHQSLLAHLNAKIGEDPELAISLFDAMSRDFPQMEMAYLEATHTWCDDVDFETEGQRIEAIRKEHQRRLPQEIRDLAKAYKKLTPRLVFRGISIGFWALAFYLGTFIWVEDFLQDILSSGLRKPAAKFLSVLAAMVPISIGIYSYQRKFIPRAYRERFRPIALEIARRLKLSAREFTALVMIWRRKISTFGDVDQNVRNDPVVALYLAPASALANMESMADEED